MCIAVPGKVIKIEGKKASVQYNKENRFALIGDELVKVGDFVMVQMGIIVKVLSKNEAKSAVAAWVNQK